MNSVILDSSAALAVLKREPGDQQVKPHIPGATMSAVNVAEVAANLARSGMDGEEVRKAIATLGVEVAPFDAELAISTGMLAPGTRASGLSLGDRACLETARTLGMPVLTADRAWAGLDIGVEVRLIRD